LTIIYFLIAILLPWAKHNHKSWGVGAMFLAAVASYIHACKHRNDLQFYE